MIGVQTIGSLDLRSLQHVGNDVDFQDLVFEELSIGSLESVGARLSFTSLQGERVRIGSSLTKVTPGRPENTFTHTFCQQTQQIIHTNAKSQHIHTNTDKHT